ncbi:carbonic anhydrase 2-like isoform X2 [Agrilus planipennis]|uniref:Carbonic anhydrase 2-like isoform X2 n=1 Tax=Agrilus planipennis TaxID=224129 RepID=A0A1W4X686_AGRPL|nr:carbonic anhydrase 2-like isoform X2 [Agrilus planipennis]
MADDVSEEETNVVQIQEPEEKDAGVTDERVKFVQTVALAEGELDSPININLTYTVPIDLPPLYFAHYEVLTKKVKLKNNGRTMVLNCTWQPKQPVPYLVGGPFTDRYEFSQLHFHWGNTCMEGSEHTVDGVQLPLEMHVVHFKTEYLTHEKAVKQPDGIAIVVYLFQLHAEINPAIQTLLDSIETIEHADTHVRLENFPLTFIVEPFNVDYFLYFGAIHTSVLDHNVIWLISRHVMNVTDDQIEHFRYLYDVFDEPMLRNFRPIPIDVAERSVFHVCPSTVLISTLLQHLPPEDTYIKPKLCKHSEEEEEEEEEEDGEETTEQSICYCP